MSKTALVNIPPINMVDLKSQYLKLKDEIDTAIHQVINTTSFINGPAVIQFESNLSKYLNCNYITACANGTDALQIALMACNLNPGDKVIVPSFTYVATVEVVALLGLIPVFAEVDPNTFLLDINHVENLIKENTIKAIIPVHLYGQSVAMDELMILANNNSIYVIEDNAQAIGCNYTNSKGQTVKTGTIGHIGCTSFYPSKNLGCYGDGGAISTNDNQLAGKIIKIANHGQTKRYYHDLVGLNSRLDSIQAAVLNVKLPHLDSFNQSRQNVANAYNKGLSTINQITLPVVTEYSDHVYHQYTIKVENRDALEAHLKDSGIPNMIYYPVPCHLQKAYNKFGYKSGDMPVTEELCDKVISLPIHPDMLPEQIDYIINTISNFYK